MIRPLTIALVLVAGMAAALVMATRDRGERRELGLLEAITADDGFVRRSAWESLPRETASERRAEILEHLAAPGRSREVLADAARGCLDLDWPIEPTHAIAAGEFGDADAFLAWFVPAVRADPTVIESARPAIRTVAATDRRPADELVATLIEIAGSPPDEELVARVAAALDDPTSPPLPRVRLALGRLGAMPPRRDGELDPVDAIRRLLADPHTDDVPVLETVPVWALATAGEPARRLLTARAAEGDDPEAARAVGLADPDRVTRAERAVLADAAFGYDRRTIAAFRLLDHDAAPGDAAILNLLDDGPADGDGTVHAAALLGTRGLSTSARDRLIQRWLGSEDADQRRAGVMLAAVAARLGRTALDPDAIATIDRLAIDQAADPRLRRTARLATRVLDRWPHGDLDADAYAARTTRLDDGRLDADTVLLGILAGDPGASRRLTDAPRAAPLPDPERAAAFARDVAWRRAIASSIAPRRFRRVGEPIPGDEDDLRLWIEALAAERLVSGPFLPEADETPTP